MHGLLQTSFFFEILASLMLIYAAEAASILSTVSHATVDDDKCSPAGVICSQDPPCCHKYRVNWGQGSQIKKLEIGFFLLKFGKIRNPFSINSEKK